MSTQLQVPFLRLQPSPLIREEIDEAYKRVMDSGIYIGGPELDKVSEDFRTFMGLNGIVIPVGNGFDALSIVLRAVQTNGDFVVSQTNVPIPVWMAITNSGSIVYPLDPNEDGDITLASLVEAFKKREKMDISAVVVTHMFGAVCPETALIAEACEERDIWMIEDCSQAHGSSAGNYGDFAIYSMYPTKNAGAYGDAGFIVANTPMAEVHVDTILKMRNYGEGECGGINSRMDALQAAFISVKLHHLNELNTIRHSNARLYYDALSVLELEGRLFLPPMRKDHVYHQFVVRVFDIPNRDELISYLAKNGIETMIHYDPFPHQTKMYSNSQFSYYRYPIADRMSKTSISLPIGPHLSESDIHYVCEHINRYFYG